MVSRAKQVPLIHEQTPLLASIAQDPINQVNDAQVPEEPESSLRVDVRNIRANNNNHEHDSLPMGQILVLCISRLVDPISFFCIFPFLPKMVETMGIPEQNVGFYTGLIESLASITQMLTMYFWGKAADRYGRKPVLVVSNLAVAIFTTLFGTSKSLWQMILYRSLCGSFTGSVISIRTMFHELSTPNNTARAFSYFAFAGNLGIALGPAIGSLARPAEQYPDIFGSIQFFHDWPYILPTAISGAVGFLAACTAFFFLTETLPENLMTKKTSTPVMTTWELVKYPGVATSILAFSWASMLGFGFTALAPVYFYTSVPLGGFGLSEKLISVFISINGIAQALWLLFAFPPLHKRLGTRRLLQGCGLFWGPFIIFFPINNFFLRQGWKAAFWAVAPVVQTVGSGVAIAFTACQLAVNEAAPSPELLGTLNGVVLTLQPAVRAIAPFLFSSIYATGVKRQILGGQLGMLVLAILAVAYFFVASMLPKSKAQSDRISDHGEEYGANGVTNSREIIHET